MTKKAAVVGVLGGVMYACNRVVRAVRAPRPPPRDEEYGAALLNLKQLKLMDLPDSR